MVDNSKNLVSGEDDKLWNNDFTDLLAKKLNDISAVETAAEVEMEQEDGQEESEDEVEESENE
jgi:hypothetical protein